MFQLEYSGQSWSVSQNQHQIASVRAYLSQQGFKTGHILALSSYQISPLYVWTLCAVWSMGGVVFPLSPHLSERELEAVLLESDSDYLIHDQAFNFSQVKLISWCPPESLSIKETGFEFPKLDQPVSLIRTSGSSGKPRLAMHSWRNHYYSALGASENILSQSDSRYLLTLPLYHVGGLAILIKSLISQAVLCLPDHGQSLEDALLLSRPSHVSLVATQLYRLLQSPEMQSPLSACFAILLGGSAIPAALIKQAYALELPIHTSYGSTEMSSQITTTPVNASLDELYSSGYLLPYRDLRISSQGEIQVKGETLFMGYYSFMGLESGPNNQGWFETRDRGVFKENNLLKVLGRMDYMFISGGENIQPEEIESVLLTYPGIIQAIVVPVKSQEYGHRPLAFIESRNLQVESLKEYLRAYLPGFKLPDHYLSWPRAMTGFKPSRPELKALAQQFMVKLESN